MCPYSKFFTSHAKQILSFGGRFTEPVKWLVFDTETPLHVSLPFPCEYLETPRFLFYQKLYETKSFYLFILPSHVFLSCIDDLSFGKRRRGECQSERARSNLTLIYDPAVLGAACVSRPCGSFHALDRTNSDRARVVEAN